MSDEFDPTVRRGLRDAFEGSSSAPPAHLRAAIHERLQGPARAPRHAGLARGVIGAVAAVVVVISAALTGEVLLRGGSSQVVTPAERTSPSVVPSTRPPSPSPAAPSLPVVCGTSAGGQNTTADPVTRVSAGAHPGYDRLVFEFGGPVPTYQLSASPGTTFTSDASGQEVTVQGTSALRLKLSGIDWTGYSGPSDLKPGLADLREARLVGNFEGVMTWAIGLQGSTCYRLTLLASPSRLVIDFPTR